MLSPPPHPYIYPGIIIIITLNYLSFFHQFLRDIQTYSGTWIPVLKNQSSVCITTTHNPFPAIVALLVCFAQVNFYFMCAMSTIPCFNVNIDPS